MQGERIVLPADPADPEDFDVTAGTKVELTVENGKLKPQDRPGYTIAELLAVSDYSHPQPPEEREWVDAPAVGGEL